MRILIGQHGAQADQVVLLFGLGLLGSSIESTLLAAGYVRLATVGFNWTDPTSWPNALRSIEDHCRSRAPRRISLSWTAGGQGFSCTEDEARLEIGSLLAVRGMIEDLRRSPDPEQLDFHFVSSAGGLFEGQRVVDWSSVPSPLRPYGHLKLRQEELLRDSLDDHELSIYRPSTVYGPMAQKPHHGLINNLVNDGLRGRSTTLDAHVMSLRDYVYCSDIGAFVSRRIKSHGVGNAGSPIHFLVSARCSSIFEVVRTIERVLHLKIRYRYDPKFGNHRNITFSSSVLPRGWAPTALDVGIRQFVAGRNAILPVPTGR